MGYLGDVGEVMITEQEIKQRAKEIGQQITEDHIDDDVILIGILRGAIMWMTDLMRHIDLDIMIDFMACSSYGSSTKSSGVVKINKDIDSDIRDKNVIIVEDIIDSGLTLDYIKGYLQGRHPKSLRICAILDKPSRRKVQIRADYVGFEVEDKFIVGYGLDFDQHYRNLPYISWLKEQ